MSLYINKNKNAAWEEVPPHRPNSGQKKSPKTAGDLQYGHQNMSWMTLNPLQLFNLWPVHEIFSICCFELIPEKNNKPEALKMST